MLKPRIFDHTLFVIILFALTGLSILSGLFFNSNIKDMDEDTVGLEGLYFHSYDEEANLVSQGNILCKLAEGIYLAQLFSWIDGGLIHKRVVSVYEMEEKEWNFFTSFKAMDEEYQYISNKNKS